VAPLGVTEPQLTFSILKTEVQVRFTKFAHIACKVVLRLRYELKVRARFQATASYFYVPHNDQTGFEACLVYLTVGTGECFPRYKMAVA
jgi:hypothetical protein